MWVEQLFSPGGIETTGSIRRTANASFSCRETLLNFLVGKKVLDLGSGAGGFAKQVYQELGDRTMVVSMNPRLVSDDYREMHFEMNSQTGVPYFLKQNGDHIPNPAMSRYSRTALAADWNRLPFGEESFDCIFATGSFLYYKRLYSDEVMTNLIKLVKKMTGQIRIELCALYDNNAGSAIEIAQSLGCQFTLGRNKSDEGAANSLVIERGEQ